MWLCNVLRIILKFSSQLTLAFHWDLTCCINAVKDVVLMNRNWTDWGRKSKCESNSSELLAEQLGLLRNLFCVDLFMILGLQVDGSGLRKRDLFPIWNFYEFSTNRVKVHNSGLWTLNSNKIMMRSTYH